MTKLSEYSRKGENAMTADVALSYRRRDLWTPMPELVADAPGPWTVIDTVDTPGLPTNGMTDKRGRVLYVPLEAAGRAVSLHELAHVKWSPAKIDWKALRLAPFYLMAVEDARINLGLASRRMGLRFDRRLRAEVLKIARRDLRRNDVVTYTLRTVASFGTNVEGPLRQHIARDDHPIFAVILELIDGAHDRLRRARMACGGEVATFEQGVQVARWLAGEFKKRGFPDPEPRTGTLIACLGHAGHGTDGGVGRMARRLGLRLPDGVPPGRMTIATPPLFTHWGTPAMGCVRPRHAVAEGTELRYPHRFFIDQFIFARRRRRGAGSSGAVLIDTSGSMCVDADGIARIIEAAPAALVAIYSGRGDHGELRIVAQNGHRADPAQLRPYGGGNVVDLPALRWLARQAAPRVWISDGHVTGCNDVPTIAMRKACDALCSAARIVRVDDAAQAAAALAHDGR
jgi:hypothetical protein